MCKNNNHFSFINALVEVKEEKQFASNEKYIQEIKRRRGEKKSFCCFCLDDKMNFNVIIFISLFSLLIECYGYNCPKSEKEAQKCKSFSHKFS